MDANAVLVVRTDGAPGDVDLVDRVDVPVHFHVLPRAEQMLMRRRCETGCDFGSVRIPLALVRRSEDDTGRLHLEFDGAVENLSTVLDIAQCSVDSVPISTRQLAKLDEAGKPISEMIIAVVPAVIKLAGHYLY